MKNIILIIVLALSVALPTMAIKRFESNPLCVAVALTEQPDSASVVSILLFYGYQPVESSSAPSASSAPLRGQTASTDTQSSPFRGTGGHYSTYRHPNGSQIRYTIAYTEGHFYPTVEVKSNLSQKSKDDTLKNLRFQKNGNHYERRSQTHLSRCTIGSNGIITISCHPKPTKPYYN